MAIYQTVQDYRSMFTSIEGYRTYVLGALALVTIVATTLGWVDPQSANTLLALFGFGSILTVRSAVKSLETQVKGLKVK